MNHKSFCGAIKRATKIICLCLPDATSLPKSHSARCKFKLISCNFHAFFLHVDNVQIFNFNGT